MDWGTWLTALGIGKLKSAGSLHFTQYEQMIQAAMNGQGVALGRHPLVKDLIESGALVAPFNSTAGRLPGLFPHSIARCGGQAARAAVC